MTDRHDAPAEDPGTATEDVSDERAVPPEAEAAEASPEAGDGGDGEELAHEADHLQEELQSLNDRHLRLAAEFQNYRRRAEGQMRETSARAQSELLRRFLDVLDDLQRVSGLDPSEESVSVQSIVEGVDLVERKFLRTLEEAGVEVIDPVGETFDPESMEAMMRVPADDPADDDRVQQVFQKGYRLEGQLVRPARVSVLKHG